MSETLRSDNLIINGILERIGRWEQERDTKIDALVKLACDDHGTEKVVVFTEYADTANYIAKAFAERGIEEAEAVTGSNADPTLAARRFSPESNASLGGMPERGEGPIRVLVSTDVLSEGQNLQDARIVVNYDLPWAVVRMVQRAGRVDRIGQTADEVLVASMLPPGGVEEVIGNHRRIRERLDANAVVFGGGERFFGTEDEEAALREAIYNEDPPEEDNGEIDVVSMAYEIWRSAQRDHPEMASAAEALPDVVYSTFAQTTHSNEPGVLVHIQTSDDLNAFAFAPSSDDLPRAITAREALRLAACEPETQLANRSTTTMSCLKPPSPVLCDSQQQPLRVKLRASEADAGTGFAGHLNSNITAVPRQSALGLQVHPRRSTGCPTRPSTPTRRPRENCHSPQRTQRRQLGSPSGRTPHPRANYASPKPPKPPNLRSSAHWVSWNTGIVL